MTPQRPDFIHPIMEPGLEEKHSAAPFLLVCFVPPQQPRLSTCIQVAFKTSAYSF